MQRGLKFAAQLTALNDGGRVANDSGILSVEGADCVTLLLSAQTSYPGLSNVTGSVEAIDPAALCSATIAKAARHSFLNLRKRRVADYRQFAQRVSLDLGPVLPDVASLPTDERITRVKASGSPDPALVANHFQFGRYLLICSSRPGTMPANLQGIWAWQLENPWNADFQSTSTSR